MYCVTMIDRFTRWPEAIPISDIKATTVAEAIYTNWICRYGVPATITTDQGAQFESSLFDELAKLLGFIRNRTTAYNPACNGMIERWHRTLKAAIMCVANTQWTKSLPSILLGLRSTFREDFNATSAELVFGRNPRLPGDFLQQSTNVTRQSDFVTKLKNVLDSIRQTPPAKHSKEKIFVFKELNNCSHVFMRTDAIRAALQPPYEGPFMVIARHEKYFALQIKHKIINISINRLKPCFSEIADTQYDSIPTQNIDKKHTDESGRNPTSPLIQADTPVSNKDIVNTPTNTTQFSDTHEENQKAQKRVSFEPTVTMIPIPIMTKRGREVKKPIPFRR